MDRGWPKIHRRRSSERNHHAGSCNRRRSSAGAANKHCWMKASPVRSTCARGYDDAAAHGPAPSEYYYLPRWTMPPDGGNTCRPASISYISHRQRAGRSTSTAKAASAALRPWPPQPSSQRAQRRRGDCLDWETPGFTNITAPQLAALYLRRGRSRRLATADNGLCEPPGHAHRHLCRPSRQLPALTTVLDGAAASAPTG